MSEYNYACECLGEAWELLQNKFHKLKAFPCPSLILVPGIAPNLALADLNVRRVELNPMELRRNFALYMYEIIAHEAAHIAAYDLYYHEKHGLHWRQIMKALGLKARKRYMVV